MSSLWMGYKKIKNKNKPSPANLGFARKNPLSHTKVYRSVKRISVFISESAIYIRGSMTIEAALLLPLFLFFFLHLGGVIEMLRLHGKLETALWNVGNQVALYTETFQEQVQKLPDVSLSYLLIRSQVSDMLGRDYLEKAPLVQGTEGLSYLRSRYLDDNECVDIIVTYQIEPILIFFPFSYRRMSNRYYARAWTGYDVNKNRGEGSYVYVSARGEVWHSSPECSYLYHQVQKVSAKYLVNTDYAICDFCRNQGPGEYLYYTEQGEKYHLIKNCTAIYKDIRAIVWSPDLPYRACSRCGVQKP